MISIICLAISNITESLITTRIKLIITPITTTTRVTTATTTVKLCSSEASTKLARLELQPIHRGEPFLLILTPAPLSFGSPAPRKILFSFPSLDMALAIKYILSICVLSTDPSHLKEMANELFLPE